MALTAQDIQSQQFHVRFRGFDVDEVDDFLEKVAENYLNLVQENKQLKERVEELHGELDTYREQEKSFQKAIVSAQQIADTMQEKSRQQAESMVAEAQAEAERLRQEAHAEIVGLEKQLESLNSQKETIRDSLKNMLEDSLARIDELFNQRPAEGIDTPAAHRETPGDEAAMDRHFDNEEEDDDELPPEELAELYQKIDLPDDLTAVGSRGETEIQADLDLTGQDDDALPDLDGEMLFSLADPLDNTAPDIAIADDDGNAAAEENDSNRS